MCESRFTVSSNNTAEKYAGFVKAHGDCTTGRRVGGVARNDKPLRLL